MTRIARVIGITLVAMLAISGVASAHSFEAEKAGNVERVTNATQKFKTGGLTVECTGDAVSNASFTSGKQLTTSADVSYSGCVVLGFIGATVSTAKYTFNADLSANLNNTVVIKSSGCTITIKPQNTLKTVKYVNKGANVVVTPEVSGIAAEPSGGFECEGTSGTYSGTTEVKSSGQTIKWS